MLLGKIPAYGFESVQHPVHCRVKEVNNSWQKREETKDNPQATKFLNKLGVDKIPNITEEDILEEHIWGENAYKILGYIPVIGALIGIFRLGNLLSSEDRKLHSYHNIQRGLLEMTSLGILNLPFDVIIHLRRKKVRKVTFFLLSITRS